MEEIDITKAVRPDEKISHESLQSNLRIIHALIEKQRLVENMVHQQDQPRSGVVESLVHR